MRPKEFRQLEIDPEFKALIRPLRREEYRQLELNLSIDGCREPLVAWGDIIVDGHNRYEICNRLGIPYAVCQIEFDSREAAIAWILNTLGQSYYQVQQGFIENMGKLYQLFHIHQIIKKT